jgi:DNA-binding XRE family transcriptional regulator
MTPGDSEKSAANWRNQRKRKAVTQSTLAWLAGVKLKTTRRA